jgi:hypothetical protein
MVDGGLTEMVAGGEARIAGVKILASHSHDFDSDRHTRRRSIKRLPIANPAKFCKNNGLSYPSGSN